MESGANETQLVQGTERQFFCDFKIRKTTVTVSSDAALAAVVDSNGQTSYYADVNDALSANEADAADPVRHICTG